MTFDNKMTLPVLILATTMVLMTAFQCRQLMTEQKQLKGAIAQQDKPLEQSQAVGKQFEALAVGTARLAEEGDETAKLIIADMTKIGIKVNAHAAAGEPAISQVQQPQDGEAPAATPSAATPATPPAAPMAAPAAPRG